MNTVSERGPEPRSGSEEAPGGIELSPIELVNTVLRNRVLVARTAVLLFVAVVALVLLQKREHRSSASFMPQQSEESSLTSSLAAQFGVSVPVGEAGRSPEFYAFLVESREILSALADTTYEIVRDGATETVGLANLYEIEDTVPARRREKVIRLVRDLITVNTERETGMIHVAAVTEWPRLSYQLTDRVVTLVNRFNLDRRQSQATEERRFVERRLDEAEDQLRAAEDRLQQFLQNNRSWQGSPDLVFAHDRLQRQVAMRQQLFTSLMQAYEQARIDEVRDTPVLTVVEDPEVPAIPEPRRLMLKGLLALFGGTMLGIMIVFGRELMVVGQKTRSGGFQEFERLKHETAKDLVRPWRLIWRK